MTASSATSTEPEETAEETVDVPDWAKEDTADPADAAATETEPSSSSSSTAVATSDFPFHAITSESNFDAFIAELKQKQSQSQSHSHSSSSSSQSLPDMIQNLRDSRGLTLLHCACISECAAVIRRLVSVYRVSINETDVDGYSALFYAVNQWAPECVAQLIPFKPRLDLTTKDCVVNATGFPIYS